MIQNTLAEYRKPQKAADLFSVAFFLFHETGIYISRTTDSASEFLFCWAAPFPYKMPQHTKIYVQNCSMSCFKMLLWYFEKKIDVYWIMILSFWKGLHFNFFLLKKHCAHTVLHLKKSHRETNVKPLMIFN